MPPQKREPESLADRLKAIGAQVRKIVWAEEPGILLHPNIPKPLHGMAPRILLGQPWWNRTRSEAYRSTEFHCIACGVPKHLARYFKHLEGHEVYEIDYPNGRMTYKRAVPLCHACHNFIHSGRMDGLVARGEMSKLKQQAILAHGRRVLRRNNIQAVPPYDGPIADWSDWRLVIDDKEYEPIIKSYDEWLRYHGVGDE